MVFSIKKLSEDEKIRMQCEAREDYERCLKSEYNAGFRKGQASAMPFQKNHTTPPQ